MFLHLSRQMRSMFQLNRKQFLKYVLVAFLPFIVVFLAVNGFFLKKQAENTVGIVENITRQSANQLSSLYQISAGIAQNISNGDVLQKDILLNRPAFSDYIQMNKNILKIQSLVKTYLFFDQIASIRFYLPEDLIVADGGMLMYREQLREEAWYRYYLEHVGCRRWYAAHTKEEEYFSLISVIRNPMDFLNVAGFLSVDIQKSYIEEIIGESVILDQTNVYLTDVQGDVIYHHGQLEDEVFEEGVAGYAGENQTEYVQAAGRSYLLSSIKVEGTDMYLACLIPSESLTRSNFLNYAVQILLILLELAFVMLLTAMLAFTTLSSKNNRLKLLNQQINPHFLYNALDMINWKAINANNPDIYRPIQKLSKFYKLTLNHGLDFISLREEFEQLNLYLEIQASRFGNRITYALELDPELSDCTILHMILQPIVENAVLHGILERESESGHIQIMAVRQDENIQITITDDGIGMNAQKMKDVWKEKETKGYGLDNIQERIRLFYGPKYGMTMKSTEGEGTCVEILFPMREQEQK